MTLYRSTVRVVKADTNTGMGITRIENSNCGCVFSLNMFALQTSWSKIAEAIRKLYLLVSLPHCNVFFFRKWPNATYATITIRDKWVYTEFRIEPTITVNEAVSGSNYWKKNEKMFIKSEFAPSISYKVIYFTEKYL